MPAKTVMVQRQGGLQEQKQQNGNLLCICWTCFDISNSWPRRTSVLTNDLCSIVLSKVNA